jgi:hypothetical protein
MSIAERTLTGKKIAGVVLAMSAGMALVAFSGCSSMPNLSSWLPGQAQAQPMRKTVGQAMVREEIPVAVYTRPGAGGIGPDGRLVVASSARYHIKPKRQLDACGNPISPVFNSAELNDDQRTLNSLIAQQERQLTAARRTVYSANHSGLKDVARALVNQNKQEIDRLKLLRRQLCKEAARAIAAGEKAALVH